MVDQSKKIFHESWYRLANQRVALRSTVRIHRQFFRGEKWYVLKDPFSNQYYRLQQSAYDFISRLNNRQTIEQVWQEMLSLDPDHAPGQGEVIQLLSQLHQANMLHYAQAEDSANLFERSAKKKQQQVKSTLLNILYLRLPLFDPHFFLKSIHPLIRLLVSRWSFVLWLILLGVGGKLALDHFDALAEGAHSALAPSNLFLLYVTGIFIKAFHEFGHACVVRRYGGEVHTVGIMFMLLAPLPYVDATAAWSFRSKRQRMLVGAGGMFFEFTLAALAMIVWANVGGGPAKAVAYNVLTIATITTLLFNANPLMKFDGYYILCDWLDTPNLQQHSLQHLKYLLERFLFRKHDAHTPALGWKDSTLFTSYGILSAAYKVVLFSGILITVSQHFLLLAVVMGVMLLFGWLVVPTFKFVKYLLGPELVRVRFRAVLLTVAILGAIFAALALIPVPNTFTAPGILFAKHNDFTVNYTPGKVVAVKSSNGSVVFPGDTLLVLSNPEVQNQIQETKAALQEAQSKFYLALAETPENMDPLAKRITVLDEKLAQLLVDQSNLVVRAPIAGIWVSPDAISLQGRWLPKGDSLGEIIDTSGFQFVAAIPQDEVSRLFAKPTHGHLVKLKGDGYSTLQVDKIRSIPMEQSKLPSAALGWFGGGEVELSNTSGNPQQTAEPFYEVRAHVSGNADHLMLMHGRSGKIRFHLGYKPLLPQLWRKLQQSMQKYYRI